MRISFLLWIIVFLAASTGAAQAAGTPSKRMDKSAMERAAKKACITGDVHKGIDLLGELYVETNDSTYLFNQGRCYQQNHLWTEALDRFYEHLRKTPNLTATERAEVDGKISECEARLAKLAPAPAPAGVAPIPPLATPAPASSATTVNLATTPAPVASDRPSGSRLRTAGIVTASVGALALVGGMVFNLYANSLTSDLNKPTGWDRGKASSRDTYANLTWVGYGVGAAALATGTTLFVLGGRSGATTDASASVALAPVLLPGFTSLSLRGRY